MQIWGNVLCLPSVNLILKMRIITLKSEMSHWRQGLSSQSSVGFVPTMGALHHGHLSLVSQALIDNDLAVISIFVNPTQFNNSADLEVYPRTFEADTSLLETLPHDRIVLFAPRAEDLYDGPPLSKRWEFGSIARVMEGEFRDGHFDGVGTVLQLLFEAVSPSKSYFGEKDYQQLLIVKSLADQLGNTNEIIGCPIYREVSGLAMSSRNQRLSEQQKVQATLLYQIMKYIKEHLNTMSWAELKSWAELQFEKDKDWQLEYLTLADSQTLEKKDDYSKDKPLRIFIAAHLGTVRLIDNMAVN